MRSSTPESPYAWRRLAVTVRLSTLGGVGMCSVVVALPAIEAEFVDRAQATLPYTRTMVGFAVGGVLMGLFANRLQVSAPLIGGAPLLGTGSRLSRRRSVAIRERNASVLRSRSARRSPRCCRSR
ncbi:MAG: hypothetical protein FWD12_02150 [Alphaproteobacteria bacterium]|nr:hypothetical protein [Alphaproteobacteria bacterium]